MLTIHLSSLRFFAPHGVHSGEQLTGNEFEVAMEVSFPDNGRDFNQLESTINYETLFELVWKRMQQATPLLEKVADDIINQTHARFPFVKRIKISIFKLQAAIPYLNGKVGITLEKEFNE